MEITQKKIGSFENKEVISYTLNNNNGVELTLMNYGATVTAIKIPEVRQRKKKINIACGFDNFESYFSDEFISNAPYFGATIGRYCATIANGSFDLDNKHYELSKNTPDGGTLHGGIKGYDKCVWEATPQEESNSVCFSLTSPDKDNGFPGKIEAKVVIALNEENEISFTYNATTNKKTPYSMTNHTYYNLSGFEDTIENYTVKIDSNKRIPLNATGSYKENIIDVTDTIEDFRNVKVIKDVQEKIGSGLENFYLFDSFSETPRKVATITDTVSKRKLEVSTTESGMLFYTGKYTSDKLKRESGEQFGKYRGFCCETHRCPNGPNLDKAPEVYITPEKPFSSKTIIKLTF